MTSVTTCSGTEDPNLEQFNDRFWIWLLLLALVLRVLFVFLGNNNGVDAWARYQMSLSWLQNPARLPSDTYLPLHFWMLGGALKVWNSEWCVRLLTALLGATTVLPYWGILRRIFQRRVAFYSALSFALFGFHIGYSTTTSVEVPTLFFLSIGVYCWIRFRLSSGGRWLIPAAVSFSAASLCRFEPWLYMPILAVFLLDFSNGWASAWSNRRAWLRLFSFGVATSAGALGWLIFSWLKWGDPLAAPHRTVAQNLGALSVLRQTLGYRLVVVPGALFVSLSPLILAFAAVGLLLILLQRDPLMMSLASLALVLFGFHYYNCVRFEATQARYTLMYSWLLIPYAFEGLRRLSERWQLLRSPKAYVSVIAFMVCWQLGILLGAQYAPDAIADRLAIVSPDLPLPCELRRLTAWLRANTTAADMIIVDEFHYQANDIVRYSHIPFSRVFQVPYRVDPAMWKERLSNFMESQRPRLLVYSRYGQIDAVFPISDREFVNLAQPRAQLRRIWKDKYWRVYQISYIQDMERVSLN